MQGLLGKKIGMTRVFDADGQQVPVTVLEVGPCVVVQCKQPERDGYAAVQVGFEEQKESRVARPQQGLFKKAGCAPMRHLHEFAVDTGEAVKVGDRGGGFRGRDRDEQGQGFSGRCAPAWDGGRSHHAWRSFQAPGGIDWLPVLSRTGSQEQAHAGASGERSGDPAEFESGAGSADR